MKLIAIFTAVIAVQTDEKCPEANRNVCVCASVSIRFFCFNLYYISTFSRIYYFFRNIHTLRYKFTMAREFASLYWRNGGFNAAQTGLQGNNEHLCTVSPNNGESTVCQESVITYTSLYKLCKIFWAAGTTRYIWVTGRKNFCSVFKLDIPFVIMSLTEMIFSNMNDCRFLFLTG